jgi:hypothetical protein
MNCVGNTHELTKCENIAIRSVSNGITLGGRCTDCRRRLVEWQEKNNKLPTLQR